MSTSSRMRLTGFSGMDVESMVQQLMDAESLKLNKYKRDITRTEWKQEAYRKHTTALLNFETNILSTSNMLSTNAYTNFNTSVKLSSGAASSAVSVKTNAGSKAGDYEIETLAMASGATAKATGQGMSNGGGTGLADFQAITGALDGGKGFTIKANGKEVTIDLSGEAANIAASETYYRSAAGGALLADDAKAAAYTDAINKQLEKLGTQYTSGVTAADIQADPNANREGVVKISLDKNGGVSFTTAGSTTYELSNTATDGTNFLVNTLKMDEGGSDYSKRKLSDLEIDMTAGATFKIGGKTINITDPDATVQTVLDEINKTGTVKASYDAYKKEFSFTSTSIGKNTSLGLDDSAGNDFADIFGSAAATSAASAKGMDAVVRITDSTGNKRIIESSSNTNIFDTHSGLYIDVNSIASGKLEVSVERNTEKSVESIKKFVEAFNTMLTDMRTDMKTKRAKSDNYTYYEPLLDEEKESLSETQIEKLEDKAKQGLLYNDSIITQMVDQIESMMMEQVDVGNGRKISLADIGITTVADYTKGGVLQIDEEKLTAYLEKNPKDVEQLFIRSSGHTMGEVFNNKVSVNDKMKNEGIINRLKTVVDLATDSTRGTLVNRAGIKDGAGATTNELYRDLTEKNNKINDMIDMLNKKEDMYYRKFSAMESAMSKANSQMSSLTSMLG